jgi:hypothetical protein
MNIEYLFLALIVFLAGIIPELTGFGVATISMALLSLFLPLELVIPLVAIISLVATGIVAFTTKTKGILKHILPLMLGSVFGVFLGMIFLKSINEDFLKLVLGVFLVLYSFYGLLNKSAIFPNGKVTGVVTGLVSGFFASLFNIHGPLIGVYSSSTKNLSKIQIKDFIATHMFFSGIFTVMGHGLSGRMTTDVFFYALLSLPFLLLGLIVGKKMFDKIDVLWVKRVVYIMIFFAGISFLI